MRRGELSLHFIRSGWAERGWHLPTHVRRDRENAKRSKLTGHRDVGRRCRLQTQPRLIHGHCGYWTIVRLIRARKQLIERNGVPVALAPEPPRLGNAAGMGDHLDIVADVGAVIRDLDRLVGGVKSALQPRVVRRDARRARVPVAAQRLDAAEREHEAARRDRRNRRRRRAPRRRPRA